MSQASDAYTEHMNSGHYERPEPLHLNLDVMQEARLVAAIQVITDAGLRVVPADWKVQ